MIRPLSETEAQLVADNHRLVFWHANRYLTRVPPSIEFDDLVSAGNFGLMRAVQQWDPEGGRKLATFASQGIKWAMNVFVAKERLFFERHLDLAEAGEV